MGFQSLNSKRARFKAIPRVMFTLQWSHVYLVISKYIIICQTYNQKSETMFWQLTPCRVPLGVKKSYVSSRQRCHIVTQFVISCREP